MDYCLICEQYLEQKSSWNILFGDKSKDIICKTCSNSFHKADIITESQFIRSIHCMYHYKEAMKQYIYQYKFLQDVALAQVFVKDFQRALRGKRHIVPIPMHEQRKRMRTFAHVEQFLQYAKIDYDNILIKQDDIVMGEKSRVERLAMKPLFKLHEDANVQKTAYTLVDDIYTTGTTLQQAAKVLLEAGATSIEAITLIRA